MTLVNNPGTWQHVYPPLLHAEWHGWTHTDLVFPFFLLIVGVALPFSLASRRAREPRKLRRHVFRRAAILILLGLFLNAFPFFRLETLRYPGVLQRIGLCYLVASLLYIYTSRRAQIAVTVALLLGYWAAMMLTPVPGYGAGRLDAEGNLAAYVDRIFFTGHMWKATWDPEGLLSTLPALATTLLGVFAGDWLRASGRSPKQKAGGLFVAGVAGLAVGALWGVWFPINKNLWTSSYVMFTAGYGLVALALCYWLIDVRGWRRWSTPFLVYGANAILLYVLSGLVSDVLQSWKFSSGDGSSVSVKAYIFERLFAPLASPTTASLLYGLAYVLLWLGIMWLFYRKRIFVKI